MVQIMPLKSKFKPRNSTRLVFSHGFQIFYIYNNDYPVLINYVEVYVYAEETCKVSILMEVLS